MSDKTNEEVADDLEENLDDYTRNRLNVAKDRRGRAMVAMNIAEDRYSAGSTAARTVMVIYLRHGIQAAIDFIADLGHHEA